MSNEYYLSEDPLDLIIFLQNDIFFALVSELPDVDYEQQIKFNEQIFSVVGDNNWNGFYDWLRQEDGSILGVRYHYRGLPIPDSEKVEFVKCAENCSNVFLDNQVMNIFLRGTEEDVTSELSKDQSLDLNFIYKSDEGCFALSFQLPVLSQDGLDEGWFDERYALRENDYEWLRKHGEEVEIITRGKNI